MIRKQVQFTERQAARIQREARRRGVSESAVIRDALDKGLGGTTGPTDEQWERALAVVGKFSSGLTDLSAEHGRYFADDLYDEIQEKARLLEEMRKKERASEAIG
jgi:polyhydroxyalkanoate synthesis regulator phasin